MEQTTKQFIRTARKEKELRKEKTKIYAVIAKIVLKKNEKLLTEKIKTELNEVANWEG